ncbi:MAG: sialidase family protein [Dokdonella sp.]
MRTLCTWILTGMGVCMRVAAAQWGPETPLSALPGDVYGEGIAVAGSTIHVIYGTNEVRYRKSVDEGLSWSAERTIDNGVIHLTDPLIADGNDVWGIVLKDIRYVSDWCCARDVGNVYLLHSGDAGQTWDAPIPLSTGQGAYRVSLAYAASRLHVVWMDYRSGVWDTYYRRSPDRGQTWDPEVRIALSAGVFGAERPQIAARGDAVHVTIWDDRSPNPPCMPGTFLFPNCPDVFHIASLNGGATWGTEVNVANAGAAFAGRNDIAVTSSSVVINYNRDVVGSDGQKLFAVRSTDNGATWETPIQLTTTPGSSDHGSIIGDGGAVHLAWHDARDPQNLEIYYRRSLDSGGTWEDEEHVSTGAAGDSSTPLLAASANAVHVLWIDRRGGSFQVYYRRRIGELSDIVFRDGFESGSLVASHR